MKSKKAINYSLPQGLHQLWWRLLTKLVGSPKGNQKEMFWNHWRIKIKIEVMLLSKVLTATKGAKANR